MQTLADLAFDTLERAILSGDLPPGTPLGEADLAGRLGVSRGPLREAIQRLEGRRSLERVPHIGVRVASLSDREVAELYAIRGVLEGLAARLAAERMTDAELDALEACAETRHLPPVDDMPLIRPGDDFHVRVAQGSGDGRLIEQLCVDMYSQLRLYRVRSGSTKMRAGSRGEHLEIVAAMRARDGDAAERLMRAPMGRAQQSLDLAAEGAEPAVRRPRRLPRVTGL